MTTETGKERRTSKPQRKGNQSSVHWGDWRYPLTSGSTMSSNSGGTLIAKPSPLKRYQDSVCTIGFLTSLTDGVTEVLTMPVTSAAFDIDSDASNSEATAWFIERSRSIIGANKAADWRKILLGEVKASPATSDTCPWISNNYSSFLEHLQGDNFILALSLSCHVNSEPKSTLISNWEEKLNPKPWTSCNTFTFYFAANATVSSLILRKQTVFIRIQKNMAFKSLYEIMHSSTKLASLKRKKA